MVYEKLPGNEHPLVAQWRAGLAGVLQEQGKLAEVESIYRKVLASRRTRTGEGQAGVGAALADLVQVLQQEGKLVEAEAACRDILSEEGADLGNEARHEAAAEAYLQLCLLDTERKDWNAATQHFGRVIALCAN